MRKTHVLPILFGVILGAAGGAAAVQKIVDKDISKWRALSDKNCALFLLMDKWMKTKQEGKHIIAYFEKNGYRTAAVYGLSHVGKCLLEELKGCDVEIKYAVDRNAAAIYSDIAIYAPEDDLPKADIMIVTAVYDYKEIGTYLKDKVSCPIVSLEDILYGLDKA